MNPEKKTSSVFSRGLRAGLWFLLFLTALAVLTGLLHWQTDMVSSAVESIINDQLRDKGEVSYRRLRGNLISEIIIEDFHFKMDSTLEVASPLITLRFSFGDLLFKKVRIRQLRFDSLRIRTRTASRPSRPRPAATARTDSLLTRLQSGEIIAGILRQVPGFRMDDLEINSSVIHFNEYRFRDINLRLGLALHQDRIDLKLKHLSGLWPQKTLALRNLSFKLRVRPKKLTLNQFDFKTEYSSLRLAADMDLGKPTSFLITIDDIYLAEPELRGLIPDSLFRQGFISGHMALAGQPLNFALSGELSGAYNGRIVNRARAYIRYDHGRILLDTLNIAGNMGRLRLNGDLNNWSAFRGHADIENFNTAALGLGLPFSDLNGHFSFNIPRLTRHAPQISGVLTAYACRYDIFKMDSMRLEIKTEGRKIYIRQPSFVKLADSARFTLDGEIRGLRDIEFHLDAIDQNLTSFGRALGQDSLRGRFTTRFDATGPLADPSLQGAFTVSGFGFRQTRFDTIRFHFTLDSLMSRRSGYADFRINRGRVYGIPLHDIALTAHHRNNLLTIDSASIYSESNYIQLAMDMPYDSTSMRMHVTDLQLAYGDYWLGTERPFNVAIDSSGVFSSDFMLVGPGDTRLEAWGNHYWDGSQSGVQLSLDKVDLQPFQQFMPGHRVSGILTGLLHLTRSNGRPFAFMDILGDNVFFDDTPLGRLDMEADYNQDSVHIRKFTARQGDALIDINGNLNINPSKGGGRLYDLLASTRSDLKMSVENIKLETYNPLLRLPHPIRGRLSGMMEILGNMDNPFMRHNFHLRDFTYDTFRLDSLNVFGQYNSGYMILDSLSGDLNGTSFSARGWQQVELSLSQSDDNLMDNPFELFIRSRDDTITFIGDLNPQVESITGPYELELTLDGTPARPALREGFINMEQGVILLSRIKDPVTGVTLKARAEDYTLTFTEAGMHSQKPRDYLEKGFGFIARLLSWLVPARKKEGYLYLSGNIKTDNLLKPEMDLNIRANQFYVDYFVGNTKVLLTTRDLRVFGRDTLHVRGNLTLPGGEYAVDLKQLQQNIYLSQPDTRGGPPYLDVNLDIFLPGNFVIVNSGLDVSNNFKIDMSGNVQASIEPGTERFLLSGLLETNWGKFSTFNQSFNVVSGTINFNNPLRINPELNIQTESISDGRRFVLTITGNLDNIRQDIRVFDENSNQELSLSEQEKITLLTLGADLSTLARNTGSAMRNMGEDVATNSLLTAAERGVEDLTGLDKVEISSSDKLLDLEKLKLNNGLKQASISFGKYLTSDLYIEYRTQFGSGVPTPKLSWDAGNRIGLEYRINRFWSLKSYYEKTIPQANDKIQVGLSWKYSF